MASPGQYELIIGQPSAGGDLITRLSADNVGVSNYTIKRDWRRDTDGETRREGHVLFVPNQSADHISQSNIGVSQPITLVHFSRKANGQTATIVGTQTALYRYFSFEDGEVYENGCYTTDVYENLTGAWLKIWDNASSSGNRWEAVDVAGQTVFSNGVDLPIIYDLGWLKARPIYELREQGIAFAGTIAEFNGLLMLGDIAELNDLASVMNGRAISSMSQSGNTVTSTVSTFTSSDIGKTITWGSGFSAKILSISTPFVVNVDNFQTVALGPVRVSTLFGTVSDPAQYSRVQYRVLSSGNNDASDFGSEANLSNVTAGSVTVTSDTPVYSIAAGDYVTIPGARPSGAALNTQVLSVDPYGTIFTIADAVVTKVDSSAMQKAGRVGSISATYDLQDDNSAILRMMELQGRLIVLKDGPIFVGTYTGATDSAPLVFQKVYSGSNSIYWKWMLGKVNGSYLLYAGKTDFFAFDLSSLSPRPHQKLQMCQNLFYDQATSISQANSFWCAENFVTQELWFMFPNGTSDQGICYDYRFDCCSTVSVPYTAAGSVRKPTGGEPTGSLEQWFVLADSVGNVYQYGLTNLGFPLWTRNGSNYTSTIQSGLVAANDEFDQKDLRHFIVYFSKYPNTPVTVTLYGTRNPHEPTTQLFQRTIVAPTYKNMIPTYFRKNFYQDKIEVLNQSTNAKIIRRAYELASIDNQASVLNQST